MFAVPTPFPGSNIAGARLMAEAWADYYAALWQGDSAASAFAEWLASFWEPSLERPQGSADAQSPYIGAGGSIEWFEREGWVSGHIPGQRGGYLVPRETVLDYPWVTLEETAA